MEVIDEEIVHCTFYSVPDCTTGCETPYTGPILTVDNVDRYFDSVGEDTSLACYRWV